MEYNFREIEKKWQQFWAEKQTFKTVIDASKPKYYVLDMFPYPSGAGLHVGHPLGYIASDIYTRFKRINGFNVLHPMGYDAFGLPAEQYAIQTGQHPAITTANNTKRYREQLDRIGFAFDWSREVKTCEADYYKWTQWIFMQLFNSWFNKESDKAEHINTLISKFNSDGSVGVKAVCNDDVRSFTANEWKEFTEQEQQLELLKYRLTYLSESLVNWCPALGTVLANDEVIGGLSERGGHPVEQKKMRQWSMRISAYSERLLTGLDNIDWPEAVKEMQRNWIGKSVGALLNFQLEGHNDKIEVFTTRLDTVFGVSFLVLAPEHDLVNTITTADCKSDVEEYIAKTKQKSERERMADVKTVSGVFTGAYVLNPLDGTKIPVWIADYVLNGYGTGAVMAVPSGDERDYRFAKHFNLPIIQISDAQDITENADPTKDGKYINSGIINGLNYQEAIDLLIQKIETEGFGKAKTNYRMRDAIFARQRYWGEPVPVFFKDNLPYLIDEQQLPLILPDVDKYLPTESGEPPLARAKDWKYNNEFEYEYSTMPGWAGSSWYWYRYMDAQNNSAFASKEAVNYWQDVDLYIGGSEHATGHLLYSRFWNKVLFDLGFVPKEEPFKKLINQGMILGTSSFVYKVNIVLKQSNNDYYDIDFRSGKLPNLFVSANIRDEKDKYLEVWWNSFKKKNEYSDADIRGLRNMPGVDLIVTPLHVDVNIVTNDILDTEAFKNYVPDNKNAEFILEDGKYICGSEVEKMSKSKLNVVNPDDIIERYGADTLRMYEMFLGPLEQSKPWNTNGISGVSGFLKKFWKLFFNEKGEFFVSSDEPTKAELKSLHKIIQKVQEDVARFSFNTSVSSYMICVNELQALKCNKRAILEPLLITLSPYAPHITEELWTMLGNAESIINAKYPEFKAEYLTEDSFDYPISINGKVKMKVNVSLSIDEKETERIVLENADVQKLLNSTPPKKIIIVKGRIVNIVL